MSSVHFTSGGMRTVSAEATLQRLLRGLGSAGDEGFLYLNPFGQNWCHMVYARHTGSISQEYSYGKGSTRTEAIVSALAEGIERRSLEFREGDSDLLKSARELGTQDFLRPNDFDGFSQTQLARGPLREGPVQMRRPEVFREDVSIPWTRMRSLSRNRSVLIPTESIFISRGARFSVTTTNGASAGNTLAECVTQGFLELVERDAHAIWWYNELQRPEVKIEGASSSYLRASSANYRKIGRDLHFLNLTHDLAVPVIAAVSSRDGGEFLATVGAHFDPEIAALRALTEMAQKLARCERARQLGVEDRNVLTARPALLPSGGVEHIENLIPLQVDDEFAFAKDTATRLNTDLFVRDMTRPEFDFPVAKVLIPGLVFYWPRLGCRRLFEVPVKMGWLEQEKAEQQLCTELPL